MLASAQAAASSRATRAPYGVMRRVPTMLTARAARTAGSPSSQSGSGGPRRSRSRRGYRVSAGPIPITDPNAEAARAPRPRPVLPQSLGGRRRTGEAQVEAVEQWPRELAAIPLDLLRKTRAFALGVAPKSARASVQIRRGNEGSNWWLRRRSPNSVVAGAHNE